MPWKAPSWMLTIQESISGPSPPAMKLNKLKRASIRALSSVEAMRQVNAVSRLLAFACAMRCIPPKQPAATRLPRHSKQPNVATKAMAKLSLAPEASGPQVCDSLPAPTRLIMLAVPRMPKASKTYIMIMALATSPDMLLPNHTGSHTFTASDATWRNMKAKPKSLNEICGLSTSPARAPVSAATAVGAEGIRKPSLSVAIAASLFRPFARRNCGDSGSQSKHAARGKQSKNGIPPNA
mmetsp:Transcript_57994/g.164412  ORF Transcript_57994/g.164412 Transcript_57994/m.164412 type:complete len:238 (-) Transcript_57994:232-945(-)